MGGITAAELKFPSLALSLTKHCQCHKALLLWLFAPGSAAASYLQGEGCEVVPRLPSTLLHTVSACRPFCRMGATRIMCACSCPW